MNFLELATLRYSSRKYLPSVIEDNKLDYVLECGRIAPSAANNQPWHIIVIREAEMKEKIAEVYPRDWFLEAPVILVICGDHANSWKRSDGKDHCDVDISIITDHLTLAAAEQDLASCWICNFDAVKCKEILQLPDHIEPIVILTLGYPADTPAPRHFNRKSSGEIIHYEKF
ncbi:MAG: nitroreductase family protein [Bacteroidales bacterium]